MMKNILGLVAVYSLLFTSGCATTSDKLGRNYVPQTQPSKIVDFPAKGEVRTAEVGESLIYKIKQKIKPAILIEDRVDIPAKNMGRKFIISLRPGIYVLRGKDETGSFYEAGEGGMEVDGAPIEKVGFGGVYVPDGLDSGTEVYTLTADLKPLSYPTNHAIAFSRTSFKETNDLSFKRELVYTGVYNNNIAISYREYKNDFARPAFTQHLTYDLSEGRAVGFRGARFEILKANNLGLTYKTLKPLD